MENKDKIIIGSLIGFGLIATGALLYLLAANRKEKNKEMGNDRQSTQDLLQIPSQITNRQKNADPELDQVSVKEITATNQENQTQAATVAQKQERSGGSEIQKGSQTASKKIETEHLKESAKKESLPANEVNITKSMANTKMDILSPVADEFPLRFGSKGKRVERLQVWLQKNYGTFGIINDTFDANLEKIVVKRFQRPFVTETDYNSKQMGLPVHHQDAID